MSRPLLSICIPTYNRAVYLKDCLQAIVGQVAALSDDVELVVSDNDSTDNTAEIVKDATKYCSIKYSKNEENIGGARNVIKIINENASGEYCWIIGDDDFIKDDGVRKILSTIKQNSDLDYFYVNYSLHSQDQKVILLNSFSETTWDSLGSSNTEEGRVNNWNDLIAEDRYGLTPIYSSVFRRAAWLKESHNLNMQKGFESVESTYPHAVIFIKMMAGKPAWRSGRPWVSMFIAQESWAEYAPVVILYRFNELLDLMEESGVDSRILKHHRQRIAQSAGEIILNILLGVHYRNLSRCDTIIFLFRRGINRYFIKSFLVALKNKISNRFIALC